jgi:hypothetical protein
MRVSGCMHCGRRDVSAGAASTVHQGRALPAARMTEKLAMPDRCGSL